MPLNGWQDRFYPHCTTIGKTDTSFPQQTDTIQEITNDHGLEDIQFNLSGSSTHSDSHIISHHLGGNHSQNLTLGGIHFTRHDRRVRFVFKDMDLPDTTSRTGAQHPDIVRNHLIDIHIRLGATSCLSNDQWKGIIQSSLQYFITNPTDQVTFFPSQYTDFSICQCRSFFQISKSPDAWTKK